MNNDIAKLNLDNFTNGNEDNIEVISETIRKIVVDSIVKGNVRDLESSLKNITKSYEKITNQLNLDEKQKLLCYYFGRISATTDSAFEVIDENKNFDDFENLINSYTLLLPALETIKRYNTVPGVILQKELKMKSSSNLSNFLNRIKKYNLVSVHKIGTNNYFSLTIKGEQLLIYSQRESLNEKPREAIRGIFTILDKISEEMCKPAPSSIKIIHSISDCNIDIRETRMLKQRIDRVFTNRDDFFKTIFKNSELNRNKNFLYYACIDDEINFEKNDEIYVTNF